MLLQEESRLKIHSMKTASYYFSRRALQKMNTSMNPKLFIFSNAFLVWMNKELSYLYLISHPKLNHLLWCRSFSCKMSVFLSISGKDGEVLSSLAKK